MQPTAPHEAEFLTVPELAALLRIKERKVYDLAASGAVPCSRATGKLLFPQSEIRAWIARESSGGTAQAPAPRPRPPIVLGSHDPLLDWAIRASGCGLATSLDGSADGLARFAEGAGMAAGLHLYDAGSAGWNVPVIAAQMAGEPAVLVRWARRARGLITKTAPPPTRLADIRTLRLAARQAGSGTALLFDHLARAEGLDPTTLNITATAYSETEAVQAVQRGDADVTLGLEAVARDFGLPFAPLIDESFDVLVDRRAWFEPGWQALMAFCRTEAFAARAATLGGYDLADFGAVLWNG